MRDPRRFPFSLAILTLVVALGCANVPASAIYHTLDIVILVPDDSVGIGDHMALTVHVLNAGIHTDPSTILADLNRGRPNVRVVVPSRVDLGIYRIQFDLLPSDVGPTGTRVTVEATVGNLKDADWTNLVFGGLDVDVVPSVVRASPGDTVAITVRSRLYGAPRDVEALFLTADVLPVGQAPRTTILAATRVSPGDYRAEYTIPTDVSQEAIVEFYARAGSGGRIGSSSAYVLLDSSSDLVVWYREVSVDDRAAVLEVFASDRTGSPVAGASVSLDYLYYTAWTPVIRQVAAVTGARGAARLDLDYVGADWVVYLSGVVETEAGQQGFSGKVRLPDVDFAPLFDVLRDNPLQFATPTGTRAIAFAAYSEGAPLPRKTIHYTARTPSELISYGTVTTDDTGRFELAFAAPPGNVRLEFASSVDGIWAYDALYVPSARPLDVEVGDFVIGGRAKVRASLPADHDAWVGLIALVPFEAGAGSLRYPWVHASATWGFYHLAVSDGAVLEQEILLPRFLPKGVDYLLYAYVVPQGSPAGPPDAYLHLRSVRIHNQVPHALARLAPNPVQVGSDLAVDASDSYDGDGALTGFQVDWGDGTATEWSGDPVASHVYDRPGAYVLIVSVRDDNGAVSGSVHVVHVEALPQGVPRILWVVVAIGVGLGAVAAVALRRRHARTP